MTTPTVTETRRAGQTNERTRIRPGWSPPCSARGSQNNFGCSPEVAVIVSLFT
jgi:hypothetical protein